MSDLATKPFSTSVSSQQTRVQLQDQGHQPARERGLGEFELRLLFTLIRRAAGNISKASRLSQLDRATIYRLKQKHGFERGTQAFGGEDSLMQSGLPRRGRSREMANACRPLSG